MPRLTKAVPQLRRHRTGQAVFSLNGRDVYCGLFGTGRLASRAARTKYRKIIAAWEVSGRSRSFDPRNPDGDTKPIVATPVSVSELSIVELFVRYLAFADGYFGTGPTSECRRIKPVLKVARELFGRTPAAEFGPIRFKSVREALVASGQSRRYVNAQMFRLRRVFKWAVENELVPAGVYQALCAVAPLKAGRCEARETEPIQPVPDAIVEATLPHLSPIVAALVRFQRLTGCRPGEACGVRPCDLDRSGPVWLYRPQRHKTAWRGKARVIIVGPQAQAVLAPYLTRPDDAYCFSPAEAVAAARAARSANRKTPQSCGNRVGTNRKRRPRNQPGTRYTTLSFGKAIGRACDLAFPHPTLSAIKKRDLTAEQKAELRAWRASKRWRPNQLRHAAATEIRKRFGIEAAQVVLGHSKADVTQIYAERDLALGVTVSQELG